MMKKLLFFGMMGAMALTFAACSSEDEVAVNPTYDGNAVKTQFAINVANGNFATRMTEANVQAGTNPTFLGLDNMTLFAFTGEPADAWTTKYELGSLGKAITFDNTNKFYTLTIPVGTDNFVFYGEAPVATAATQYGAKGVLTQNVSDAAKLSEIEFTLNKRAANDLFTGTAATAIITKLNAIAAAKATVDGAEKTWAGSEDATLKAMYTNFTNTTRKIRAGYDFAINRILTDLKESATQLASSGLTAEVKAIAQAIVTEIGDYTVSNFPGADMPNGAAQLVFAEGAFSFKATPDLYKTETVNPQKIAYPASLVYWDNSDLRATDPEKTEADYPNGLVGASAADGYKAWFPDASWTSDWKVGAVKATTRAIAMRQNINYGVAGLHTTVSWTAKDYEDNTKNLVAGATANEKYAVKANSFALTGVLVGGQPEKANWKLLPGSTNFDWVVYDNNLVEGKNESYTLLLDNYAATAKDVLVALEFTNNLKKTITKTDGTTEEVGADFYGVDGIIPAGGTFYLVGKLTFADGDDANYEQFENPRLQTEGKRIFAQDHMTEATFTFSDKALQNAYETIPDLQSVAMMFGLSVDIKWLKGLTFSDIAL